MHGLNLDTATHAPGSVHARGSIPGRASSFLRRVVRHYEAQAFAEQWFIALRPRRPEAFPSSMEGFRIIAPPLGRFYADPFLIEWSGRHYVFFEEYFRGCNRGRIAYCEIRPDGTLSEPQIALERASHLAYPFVFAYDDALYMIPETADAKSVELYRARKFPGLFEFERILLREVNAVDTTLVVHQGRFWLLMNQFDYNIDPHSALHAYWSDALEGPWRPHPGNPIVTDRAHGTARREDVSCRRSLD